MGKIYVRSLSHLLKEAEQGNRLSHVYLELYYIYSVRDNFNGGIDPVVNKKNHHNNWQNTDFMKPSLNKLLYMSSIGTKENYADSLFAFSRYRSNLDNWDYIKSTIEEKQSEQYRSYEWHYEFGDNNGYDDYLGQGYFFSTRNFLDEQRLFEQSIVLAENSIGEKSERYIRKIISFCQKKDIPITLFISPIDDLEIVSTEDYDHYSSLIQDIASEYEVEFYDFNLVKEEYLPIRDGKYFRDVGHLNCDGAEMYTLFFNKVMSGNYENNEIYFYSSYEEKCRESSPAIFGLYYRDLPVVEENSQLFRRYSIASNREEGIEYHITVFSNEGEEYVVQNFQKEKSFVLPAEQHGICTIMCRNVGEKEVLQTLKVNY